MINDHGDDGDDDDDDDDDDDEDEDGDDGDDDCDDDDDDDDDDDVDDLGQTISNMTLFYFKKTYELVSKIQLHTCQKTPQTSAPHPTHSH